MHIRRRWLIFLTASLCLLSTINALRATSLIFGRVPNSLTTTSTETTATNRSEAIAGTGNGAEEESDPESEDEQATKLPLTGIPQIDYIYDPNLPRELNGFNLSTYPFLSLVPDSEDIDFKCEGLHDGFYASIKFGCQLYHHCIYGIRHDFLCANFTAFDQKTFICQFVSVVDCKSSPKYWFRNDALYRATTTTSTTTKAPPTTPPPITERPYRRRRPLRRRRPQIEYYYDDDFDDYYEDDVVVNKRNKPPTRNRGPRPDYDEYDTRGYSYDDEGSSQDRYRNKDRMRPQHRNRNRNSDKHQYYDDDRDDRRYNDNNKRQSSESYQENNRRVPIDDASERRRYRNRRPVAYDADDARPLQNHRTIEQDEENPPRKTMKYEGPKARPSGSGAAVYKAPRPLPRIRRPVPVSEKKKFEYIQSDKMYDADDDDYELSIVKFKQPKIEPESSSVRPIFSGILNRRIQNSGRTQTTNTNIKDDYEDAGDSEKTPQREIRPNLRQPITTKKTPIIIDDYEEDYREEGKYDTRSRFVENTSKGGRLVSDEYDDVTESIRNQRQSAQSKIVTNTKRFPQDVYHSSERKEIDQQQDDSSSQIDVEKKELCSKNLFTKRPFLPSRGGSPYLPRGLKPLGNAVNKTVPTNNDNESSKDDLSNTQIETVDVKHESPKVTLEKIYNSEYDATLNDALTPTLKPLALSSVSPVGFSVPKRVSSKISTVDLYQSDIPHAESQTHRSIAEPSIDFDQSSPSQYYDYDY